MADVERGNRIRDRREELHLTQPVVVDEIEKLAWALPATHRLHPDQPKLKDPKARSKPPITLRGYQTWEAGGGVDWEKAKLLVQVLQTDTRTLINGIAEDTPTPSPFPETPAIEGALADVLADIKAQLAEQTKVLDEIKGYAARVERMLEEQRGLKEETDGLVLAMRAVVEGRPVEEPEASQPTRRSRPRAKT